MLGRKVILLVCVLLSVISSSRNLLSADNPPPVQALVKLFPELKNPRLMVLKDLPSDDGRIGFKDYGYSFWLSGDFNGDNVPDQAIAGHFENSDQGDVSFIAVLTRRNGKWNREFMYRPKSDVTMLKLVPHPDKAKARKGIKAVLAQFTEMPSDDYVIIYWNGSGYHMLSGFDATHWEGYIK